jgi:hypothetical protein
MNYFDKEYDDGSGKLPNQKELEKELSDYLSKKYGNRIKIVSPFVCSTMCWSFSRWRAGPSTM